mmetsp:Transcript_8748/g.24991  ORF Transcript_8748/g.24991 Transcript_8748/m.24991 type:complete len:263 (-) Transcript_8748:665-1453(-)
MTLEAARELGTKVQFVGLDQDETALEIAQAALCDPAERGGHSIQLLHGNFANLPELVSPDTIGNIDAMLLDIGVSSMQLDRPERGFSFRNDGPLDMRMDANAPVTARHFVNEASADLLSKVLRHYGEEPRWRQIVTSILEARKSREIRTTRELVQAIGPALDWKSAGPHKVHPATRTFQGIRIAVNNELHVLSTGLDAAHDILRPGGLLAVITFHSVEDRIVKRALSKADQWDTHKLVKPGKSEIAENPRARSAKLRFATKV